MTARGTVEALLYELRAGLGALADEGTRGRLGRCNKGALREVIKRLKPGKGGRYDPNWSPEDIQTLIADWKRIKGKR